jgi:hypothetical protein
VLLRRLYIERSHRLTDPFQKYVLPATAIFFFQFWHLGLGFKAWTILPSMLWYTRMRDKTLDPDFKETYLREMMYNNPEIAKLFNEETIHVLDYDCEYDKGYPDEKKFPEFKNKLWRFFNSDTHMTTGFFKFGDVESGATMTLKVYRVANPV